MTHNLNNEIAIVVTGGDFSFPSPPEPESEMSSSTFRDFFSLSAGLSPAEGSVKPTAGFTLNKVNWPER